MIKAFDVPTQDVEVKSITPTADDKTIYLAILSNLQELVHQNATLTAQITLCERYLHGQG